MNAPRPRLLFIAPAMPDAGGNGLAMRQAQFLSAYARHYDVDVVVIPLAGPADADRTFARRLAHHLTVLPLAQVDTHFSLLMRITNPEMRLAAFIAYGRPSIAARLSVNIREALAARLAAQHYALVHVGRLYLLGVVPAGARCLVDADEDDTRVFSQMARSAKPGPAPHQSGWLAAEAAHFASANAALLPSALHVFAASQADASALAGVNPRISVIPNTVARPWTVRAMPGKNRILFVGTLSYGPNADAVRWFISQCWHRLHRRVPALTFDVVGGGAPPDLQRLMSQQGVIWHGRQRRLGRFYTRAGLVIVPVRMGGGSRIKLLEAAAHGRAIVATKAGAEGCMLRPSRDFACADSKDGFIAAVRYALRREAVLARAARRAVARGHDPAGWQARILQIADIVASMNTL